MITFLVGGSKRKYIRCTYDTNISNTILRWTQ